MNNKFYYIGGLYFQVNSYTNIEDSELYKSFIIPDCKPDIIIDIKNGELPPRKGNLISTDNLEFVYDNNGIKEYFSFYYENEKKKFYAYHTYCCNCISVITDSDNGLWDSMVFSIINLPRILSSYRSVLCHCSYIIYKGEAILFSAPKCSGKSTQADIWKENKGAAIINGDRAILRVEDGRLFAFGTPYCGSSRIAENVKAPVKAIVFLGKAKENFVEILDEKQSFLNLYNNVFFNTDCIQSVLETVIEICNSTKMYIMRCLPEKSAADLLEEVLWN